MKTKTIFRKFKDTGEIIAIFPEIPHDVNGMHCMSYMQIGQHGAASDKPLYGTILATASEYAPLQRELERIGYDIQTIKRAPRDAYKTRIATI